MADRPSWRLPGDVLALAAPASGRQYATLARMFGRACDGMPFIAENGAYVVRDGAELASAGVDRGFVIAAIGQFRDLARGGRDLGVVLCGKRSAYVERGDEPFLAEARQYYAALEVVDDVLKAQGDVLKLAVYDVGDAESGTAPALTRFRESHGAAGLSFAMANAHPEVLARARAIAPSNTEGGVVTVLTQLLTAELGTG